MAGRTPEEIWEEGLDEGERRLKRSTLGLAATGFAGGAEVALGILAATVATGAAHTVLPEQPSHVIGALFFGIAFVLITLGRAELFTENFHIPVGAVYAKRATLAELLRMWGVTLVLNLAGLAVILGLLAVSGVLKPETVSAAGPVASTYGLRPWGPALASAVVAGVVMTLFTWVVAASESVSARVLVAMGIGFLLVAPSLNHAVVGFGNTIFGIFTNTAPLDAWDVIRTLLIAIAGNLIGGIGLVFTTRVAQVRGEPDTEAGQRPAGRADGLTPAGAQRVDG
jgi:formate/nitrite transporter FocA (FNT family)